MAALRAFLTILYLFNICAGAFCFPENRPSYPQRIISLSPALTEALYILGADKELVGVTTYCQRPPAAQEKEKIGTVTTVNLEKIVSLKPDLVLATPLIDLKTVEKLKNLNIKIITFPPAKNFSRICGQFLELGRIVAREKEAEEIVVMAKREAGLVKKKFKDLPKQKVFVQIGARPLYTATRDSFINDFIEFAGGTNVAFNSKSGLYSREKVLKDNPDIIIIATMGIAGKNEKETWERFKALKAAKNNRIYIVDSYKLCNPNPVSFVEGLNEIVKILHPEEAKK